MTTEYGRKVLAKQLIQHAKDHLTMGEIRRLASDYGAPIIGDGREELTALAALINDAKITITWG